MAQALRQHTQPGLDPQDQQWKEIVPGLAPLVHIAGKAMNRLANKKECREFRIADRHKYKPPVSAFIHAGKGGLPKYWMPLSRSVMTSPHFGSIKCVETHAFLTV